MNQREAQALADEVESIILTIGHLVAIAVDQAARDGSSPGPQLDQQQVESTLTAAELLSKDAHSRFCALMTVLEPLIFYDQPVKDSTLKILGSLIGPGCAEGPDWIPLAEFAKGRQHEAARELAVTQGAISKAVSAKREVYVVRNNDGTVTATEVRPFPSVLAEEVAQ